LDRYLARTGFQAQQTGEPKDPDQPANLFEPADGPDGRDFGAHGGFDDQAKPRSVQQWIAQHLPAVTGAAVTTAAVLTGVIAGRRRAA
jgi:hypothetical protein